MIQEIYKLEVTRELNKILKEPFRILEPFAFITQKFGLSK